MGLTLSDVTRGEWMLVGVIFALVVVANLVRRLGTLLHRNLADAKLLSDREARYAGADFDDSASENADDRTSTEPSNEDDGSDEDEGV